MPAASTHPVAAPATDGPQPSGGLAQRGLVAAPYAALALGLALQVWVGLRWIRLDQSVGEGVFPYGSWPMTQMLERIELGKLSSYLTSTIPPDLFSFTGLTGRALFGANPDALLITILVLLVIAQLLLFDIARWLGSPWAGVLAALLLPLAPDTGTLAHRWAAQLPHMLILVSSAACLVRSRSFTRWLPTVGFTLCVMVGMAYSVWLTDNLLFLVAAGSMAVAVAVRGLALNRGPTPGPLLGRRRVLGGSLAVAAVLAAGTWLLVVQRLELSYYVDETMAEQYGQALDPKSPQALLGYLRFLWRDAMGPVLCIAAFTGAALYARYGTARAELLGWLLLPLLGLSIIAKKNSYYLAVIYPVIPLVTALGLARIPWRWLRIPAMLLVLATAWWSWQGSSLTPTTGSPPRPVDYDPAFQTVNLPVLGYRQDAPYERELRITKSQRRFIQAEEGTVLCIMPMHETAALELALEPLLPDTRIRNNPVMAPCDFLLIRHFLPPGSHTAPRIDRVDQLEPQLQDILQWRSFVLMNQDTQQSPVLYLLRQDRSDTAR